MYDYDYDDDDDVVYGDVNNPDVITYVELDAQNTQYTKANRHALSPHLQIIQADNLKEQCKNQTIQTKSEKSCTTTYYVTVTMGMCQNIIIPSFKVEQYRPTYYILPANIYGSGIQDASNNICSIYMWTEFEGKKGMNNIASWLLL